MPINWITADEYIAEPWEVHGTSRESWSNDRLTADVELMCPWADRYDVLVNILKYALPWPYHISSPCRAVSGSIRPFVARGTEVADAGLSYDLAVLAVHFEAAEDGGSDENGNTIVFSEQIAPASEFLTLPYEDFRWMGDSDQPTVPIKPDEAPGRLVRGLDYVVTWYNFSSIPAVVLTAPNHVNLYSVVSASLGLTFDAQTLLFQPPTVTRNVSFNDANRYQLQCRFTWRLGTWNKFWRAETGDYEYIYHKDAGGTPYLNFPTADFSGLVP